MHVGQYGFLTKDYIWDYTKLPHVHCSGSLNNPYYLILTDLVLEFPALCRLEGLAALLPGHWGVPQNPCDDFSKTLYQYIGV